MRVTFVNGSRAILAAPGHRTTVRTLAAPDGVLYRLVHDQRPERWYVERQSLCGALSRTIVYPHRMAPGLQGALMVIESYCA